MKNGKSPAEAAAVLDRLIVILDRIIVILDRITETGAYLETEGGGMRRVPREALPAGAREGDMLRYAAGAWRIDAEETEKRRKLINQRLERLIR